MSRIQGVYPDLDELQATHLRALDKRFAALCEMDEALQYHQPTERHWHHAWMDLDILIRRRDEMRLQLGAATYDLHRQFYERRLLGDL